VGVEVHRCVSYEVRTSSAIKSKTIPVTGRGGLYDSEMLRIPYCLDNRLTDGGKLSAVALLPRNIICLLLVLISVRGRVTSRA
jgi:hypothetical protein